VADWPQARLLCVTTAKTARQQARRKVFRTRRTISPFRLKDVMVYAKHLVSQRGSRSTAPTARFAATARKRNFVGHFEGPIFARRAVYRSMAKSANAEFSIGGPPAMDKTKALNSPPRRCWVKRFSQSSGLCADFHNSPRQSLREPNQAPVIHSLFIDLVIHGCLSTHILGIIAARAVPPSLFQEPCQGSESGIRVENGVWEIRS
jgi:hypothetical protein